MIRYFVVSSEENGMCSATEKSQASQIPIVDLLGEEDEEGCTASVLRSACLEYGFFALTNHGVDPELIARQLEMQKRFFDLPLEDKLKISVDAKNRGYTPMGSYTLDKENSNYPDDHEGLYFGAEASGGQVFPLCGRNQWPSEELLPGYRELAEEYISEMTKLGMRVLKLLAKSLFIKEDYFIKFFQVPTVAWRPIRYSATLSDPDAGRFGAGAHTDFGMITFLVSDQQGLQNCVNGIWEPVVPPEIPGVIVCNFGDLVERWTNGLYKSTLHRVINCTGKERVSVPVFFQPGFDTVIEPLLLTHNSVRLYPTTTFGELALAKFPILE